MPVNPAPPSGTNLPAFALDLRRLATLVHVPVTGPEDLRLNRNAELRKRVERILGWPRSEYLPAKSTVSRLLRGEAALRDWRNVGPVVALCLLKAKDRNITLDKIEHHRMSWWQEQWKQAVDAIPALDIPVPDQLPPDVSHFTGRDADIAMLDELLPEAGQYGDSAHVMVISAIGGTPGVGKTALAIHWAHRVKNRFPHGRLHINLHGYDPTSPPMNPSEALSVFLRSLGVSIEGIPTGLDERVVLYRSLMANRRVLVVLDNAKSVDQVRPLLPGSPTCMVVVTSRNRMSGLIAQDGAYPIRLDYLSSNDSVELLRQLVGVARLDAEREVTGELARQCSHLPLALRIAAEHIAAHPHMRLDNFVRELAHERNRLDLLVGDDRSSEVRAVFSWSYTALSPETAGMFRILGLHPGPDISLLAATALADNSVQEVRRLMNILISMHLLSEVQYERYRLHDLLRVYAAECAEMYETVAERQSASKRLLAWYLVTAGAAGRAIAPHRHHIRIDPDLCGLDPLTFPSRNDALEWCEVERINLVAAVHNAAERGFYRIAIQLPLALTSFFNLRKHWPDWVATHVVARDAARKTGDRFAESSILNSLGIAYREQRRFDEAIHCDERALEIRRAIGDRRGEGTTLINLGDKYEKLGKFEEAINFDLQALSVARETGDRLNEAISLTNLGEASHGLRKFEEAIAYHNRALAIHRELGDRQGEGAVLDNIGQELHGLKRFEEAIEYYQHALDIRKEVGDQHGECITLENLGNIWNADDLDRARHYWLKSLAIAMQLGDQYAADRIDSVLRTHEVPP